VARQRRVKLRPQVGLCASGAFESHPLRHSLWDKGNGEVRREGRGLPCLRGGTRYAGLVACFSSTISSSAQGGLSGPTRLCA
jgi:hypothetical protein